MKIFLDTADVDLIEKYYGTGLIDGVTTNPSLIHKSGRDFFEVVREICDLVDGPVSAEVASTDFETMLSEGRKLAGIADNVCEPGCKCPVGATSKCHEECPPG